MTLSAVFRRFAAGLTCVSALSLAAGPAAAATPMSFQLVPYGDRACGLHCPEVISAEGEITNKTPDEFLKFVEGNLNNPRLRSVVFLHSPGGGVLASMQLGAMFRKTKVLAIVGHIEPGILGSPTEFVPGAACFSACVYALMGAKKRIVPRTSRVGIHRMFFDQYGRDSATGDERVRRTYGTKNFVAKLANYASAMGVSRDLVRTAEQTDSSRIHIVTPLELRRWHLGTDNF